MGLLDRDWYWQRRAKRNSPDDDYLFPNRRSPGRKGVLFPTALAVLAVLALLVFGLHQGWFDTGLRSHADQVEAENRALRAWDSERPPSARPPDVPRVRAAPPVETFHDKYRLPIEFTLLGLTILSPFVLLGLFIGLFIRRLRVPALIGLLLGPVVATVVGNLHVNGTFFRWGLLYPADSMGGAFQFFEVIFASFAAAAIVSAIAVGVFGKPGPPSDKD